MTTRAQDQTIERISLANQGARILIDPGYLDSSIRATVEPTRAEFIIHEDGTPVPQATGNFSHGAAQAFADAEAGIA